MNTKVKVGIAAVIVAALAALIVLDQKTTPKDAPAAADGSAAPAPPASPDPNERVTRMREEDVRNLIRKAGETFIAPTVAPPAEFKSPDAPPDGKAPPSGVRGDEWVIEKGDTLETIAEAKYGSARFAALIAQANPDAKASALRVGKKLVLPPKPEERAEAVSRPAAGAESTVASVNGQRTYTVQPGDTLSGISTKIYNTSRYVGEICAANRIGDPSTLYVGAKLVLPDLPVRGAASPSGAVATAASVPAGARSHEVQSGDSLWKIAEKYAAERGVSILEMIRTIVQANPDKLKDERTMLRLGWQLIVPD